jgi:hypothetical protein
MPCPLEVMAGMRAPAARESVSLLFEKRHSSEFYRNKHPGKPLTSLSPGKRRASGISQKPGQGILVEVITANFLSSSHEDGDELVVARPEFLVLVDIHDIETKSKPSLEFLQGGYHFVAKMAVLAAVEGK